MQWSGEGGKVTIYFEKQSVNMENALIDVKDSGERNFPSGGKIKEMVFHGLVFSYEKKRVGIGINLALRA